MTDVNKASVFPENKLYHFIIGMAEQYFISIAIDDIQMTLWARARSFSEFRSYLVGFNGWIWIMPVGEGFQSRPLIMDPAIACITKSKG